MTEYLVNILYYSRVILQVESPSSKAILHIAMSAILDVGLCSLAPMMAVLLTNPFDVAKVRMQLQGELLRRGSYVKVHPTTLHVLAATLRAEGIAGCQRGLPVAIVRECSKNSLRIGLFAPLMNVLHDRDAHGGAPPPLWKRFVGGMITGPLGAIACNPFEVLKTRLQSAVPPGGAIAATGHQHTHVIEAVTAVNGGFRGVAAGLRATVAAEGGMMALWKGVDASMVRSAIGTSTNLGVMYWLKDQVMNGAWDDSLVAWGLRSSRSKSEDGIALDIVCAAISSFVTTVAINPIDVVRTRVYNQPFDARTGGGARYASLPNAVRRIYAEEGASAFFKGFVSHYLRVGPHVILTFVFLGALRRAVENG